MDTFETANILVALGGDMNNTVPKYDVPAGEIAVLQVIHGNDAITEIEPVGVVKRSNRAEKARLTEIYGRTADRNGNSLLEKLYPGAAARIFQRIDELELVESQFKPGLAPEGLTEHQAKVDAAIAEGKLLSDGSLPDDLDPEDAANGLDELPGDPEPEDAASALA